MDELIKAVAKAEQARLEFEAVLKALGEAIRK